MYKNMVHDFYFTLFVNILSSTLRDIRNSDITS
jgi:hypothetical protein